MSMTATTTTQRNLLKMHEESAPAELVASMEAYCAALSDIVDVQRTPTALFDADVSKVATGIAMESVYESIKALQYDAEETICMEGVNPDDPDETKVMSVAESHIYNLQTLMENSATQSRIANERNLNEITPFDGFLPFVIMRSYLPLVGKDIMPYIIPKINFIRIKEKYKYITTKDNKSYLRPDVYSDPDAVSEILNSAKGRTVTDAWFPAGTEVSGEADADYTEGDKFYKVPTDGARAIVDILAESGGVLEIGDALDIDVHVEGARGVVTNSEGTTNVVEVHHLDAYPDIASYSPQRSVSATIKYAVKNNAGEIEQYVEDRIFGSYNARTSTFEIVSATGVTKQVCFGGHLSNKNNTEWISYRNEYNTYDHPIPEGYNMNVPLTLEDEQLYRSTSSISIIADAINEMTEISVQLEDMEMYNKIRNERTKWTGVKGDAHPFIHFNNGPVATVNKVNVAYTNGQLLKRNQYVQDKIQYALSRLIGEVRTTCGNEPFKIVSFCHPNIASLFVGDNIDWKIENGNAIVEGIRSDYSMGIYTADGNSFKLVASQKFKEEEGLQGIVLPVNETNFLSWKHFRFQTIFSKEYHVQSMPNNPNIRCLSNFHTQSYVPLTIQLLIEDYK